jgi:hypothetical protein
MHMIDFVTSAARHMSPPPKNPHPLLPFTSTHECASARAASVQLAAQCHACDDCSCHMHITAAAMLLALDTHFYIRLQSSPSPAGTLNLQPRSFARTDQYVDNLQVKRVDAAALTTSLPPRLRKVHAHAACTPVVAVSTAGRMPTSC